MQGAGDGLPGEVGVRVRVITLTELEQGPALDPATIPLHLVVAGIMVIYLILVDPPPLFLSSKS